MEEINLNEFFEYYKKYLLIVLGTIVVFLMGTIIYDIYFKVPVYTTSTTVLLVKNESDTESINQNDITLNQKLVSTYRQIIKSKRVLNQVIKDLDLKYDYEKLYDEVNVTSMEDTEILKITVTDKNPNMAVNLANNIARVFNAEITEIYNINNVSIIDEAELDMNPSNNNLVRDMVLAILVGFILSSGVIFVIFYFDDTLRDINFIENDIKLPLIGKVYKDNNKIDLLVEEKPNALASECIRTLRTNLQFSSVDEELKTLLVTSSLPSEGKSFVSANLAISFAQNGKKVLLVDCDLRKGRQHKIFNVDGTKGLSSLLISDVEKFDSYIEKTDIKNLSVIPRGVFPPNPSELLNSKKNAKLVELLKEKYDIVIFDGAPIMGLSDSLILSSLVDKVLVVTSINQTPKSELKNATKALTNIDANIAGIVANNISMKKHGHSGYYYYYSEEKTN